MLGFNVEKMRELVEQFCVHAVTSAGRSRELREIDKKALQPRSVALPRAYAIACGVSKKAPAKIEMSVRSGLIRASAVSLDPKTGTATFRLETTDVKDVDQTFDADGAFVRLRLGYPEIVFLQLHPLNEKQAVRAVVVRYDPNRFVDRSVANEPFRSNMLPELIKAQSKRRTSPGSFVRAMEAASGDGVISATIQAEFEAINLSGVNGFVAFVTMPGSTARALGTKDLSKARFIAELEVRMPFFAMVDLLDSWKELAHRLSP